MYVFLQQVGGYILVGVWLLGIILLYVFYFRRYQRLYLQQFPPINGVPFDMYVGGNPGGPEARAISSVLMQPQSDPELERMRLRMWRRYAHLALWLFGFPVVAGGLGLMVLAVIPH